MLKQAYQIGVEKALEEFGLTKKALTLPLVAAGIGAAAAKPGERGQGAFRAGSTILGGELGTILGSMPAALAAEKIPGRLGKILAALSLAGGAAAGGYGAYRGAKAITE